MTDKTKAPVPSHDKDHEKGKDHDKSKEPVKPTVNPNVHPTPKPDQQNPRDRQYQDDGKSHNGNQGS